MAFFQQNIDIIVGLLLVLAGIFTFIFPPKFGNFFYAAAAKWALKNETVWGAAQKLFAISTIIIGLVFLVIGIFNLREKTPSFSMVLLLIALWSLSKYFVYKILEKKYPGI